MQAGPDQQGSLSTNGLVHRSLKAMGCRFELILDPNDSPYDRFGVEAIADEFVELIQDWHDRLNVFSPTSIATRINTAPVGTPVRVDRDFFELLRLCEQLCEETDGAFNIAAGTLMRMHGFREQHAELDTDSLNLRHAFSLDTENMSITRNDNRVSLDFGAIAKGFILDILADELRGYGIQHAFIHGGSSSVLGFGYRNGVDPWKVRISKDAELDAHLHSTSLGVSEYSGRINDQHDGHIMNPATGLPARSGVSMVACTHPSAAIADAYSTALSVHPELIDRLHDHGCSIVLMTRNSKPDTACIRDRLDVFTNPLTN